MPETRLEQWGITSPTAAVIIALALMLLTGFLMTRLTKRVRLPNVTAYILAGIALGPYCLDLIPRVMVERTEFLPDIALAFIAFSTGEFFEFSALRRSGSKAVVITLAESLTASLFVFAAAFWILRLELAFSVVLAALAAATAPASTMMTIRQTGARGDFVETLLQVVALDDIVGLVAYSVAVSVALSSISGEAFRAGAVLLPLAKNAAVLALGGLFGWFLKLLIPQKRSTDNRLIIALALLFAFCGVCALLDISPLLGCMSMGMIYRNLARDDKLFKQLNYFSPPILLLFFVRSGISFELGALTQAGAMGSHPLLLIGVLYFFFRIAGKYLGTFAGCALAGKGRKTRDWLGLALVPQAGVAIGLAALGARTLGGETGSTLQTVILSSSVLYELAGPGMAKLALFRSGSYSHTLEELAPVPEVRPDGGSKTSLELLIERIQAIQAEIPAHPINEEETAFTEAAEEYYEQMHRYRYNQTGFRRRWRT